MEERVGAWFTIMVNFSIFGVTAIFLTLTIHHPVGATTFSLPVCHAMRKLWHGCISLE